MAPVKLSTVPKQVPLFGLKAQIHLDAQVERENVVKSSRLAWRRIRQRA